MSFIALFCPASISMLIRHKRGSESNKNVADYILEYACLLFANVLITQIVVVYGLGLSELDISVLNRFSFFTKYSIIAFAIAFFIPYVEETIKKYFSVCFSIEVKNEKEEK